MKKYTGTIILAFLAIGFGYVASIFGVDAVLSTGSHATISEYVHNWLQQPANLDELTGIFLALMAGLSYLFYHFVSFKPKQDSENSNKQI